MKTDRQAAGSFDGVWWPRSAEAVEEFSALAAAVAEWAAVPVTEIAFDVGGWQSIPVTHKLTVGNRDIHLEGSDAALEHTVIITGVEHRRIRLLVVPRDRDGGDVQRIARAVQFEHSDATALEILGRTPLFLVPSTDSVSNPERTTL